MSSHTPRSSRPLQDLRQGPKTPGRRRVTKPKDPFSSKEERKSRARSRTPSRRKSAPHPLQDMYKDRQKSSLTAFSFDELHSDRRARARKKFDQRVKAEHERMENERVLQERQRVEQEREAQKKAAWERLTQKGGPTGKYKEDTVASLQRLKYAEDPGSFTGAVPVAEQLHLSSHGSTRRRRAVYKARSERAAVPVRTSIGKSTRSKVTAASPQVAGDGRNQALISPMLTPLTRARRKQNLSTMPLMNLSNMLPI